MPLASSANLDVSNLCKRLYRSQMRGADQGLRQRQGSQLLRGDREFLFQFSSMFGVDACIILSVVLPLAGVESVGFFPNTYEN